MQDAKPRARTLFERATIWDNVWPVDLPGSVSVGNGWPQLERFRKAGVNVLGVTLAGDNQSISQAAELVGWARRHVRENSARYLLVESVDDVALARSQGKLALVFQFEGTRCFERNLDMVELFYRLGVKQTLLAFNNANCVGGGCAEEQDGGLTRFGRRFVAKMQKVGMLVDLSHVGHRTSLDALAMATAPMAFTHSNIYALHDSFRNVRDDQIKACAATGGVVGISGSSGYLGDPDCRTESLFRHLDYVVQLVGASHAAIGMDVVFDGVALSNWVRSRPHEWPMAADPNWPGFRYAMPEQLEPLAIMMLEHGYDETAVLNIFGDNYLRICREVWR